MPFTKSMHIFNLVSLSVSIYSKPCISKNGARRLCLFTLTSPQKLICWTKSWLSANLPLLFKISVQECREWAGCTSSALVLKTRGFVAQKGVKETEANNTILNMPLWDTNMGESPKQREVCRSRSRRPQSSFGPTTTSICHREAIVKMTVDQHFV